MAALSPMMQQYMKIKETNPGSILFFRLGDFYEMFFDDAVLASKELELTLTGRDCGQAPMCGVPYHSAEGYIARLVEKGYRVAICEQTEDPAAAKGIVKREIVRVITPGTVIDDTMLEEGRNNYLGVILKEADTAGLCFVDCSTGELNLTEISGAGLSLRINNELARYLPREILVSTEIDAIPDIKTFIRDRLQCKSEIIRPSDHTPLILKHFGVSNMEALGIHETGIATAALGETLSFLYDMQKSGLSSINAVNFYTDSQFMKLDLSARRNLEISTNIKGRDKKGTLLWVLDHTKTAMGKRLIRSYIEQPLLSCAGILKRQNGVDELLQNSILRGNLGDTLEGIYDLERLMTRIVYGSANARELNALAYTVSHLPEIKELIHDARSSMIQEIHEDMDELTDIKDLIGKAIAQEPPITIREGGIIKTGYNTDVDTLRSAMTDGKGFIAGVEATEKERTGIKNLRVGYNRVFGYYIEILNSNKSQVPPEYIRKQTLSNCERYITEELKELEGKVLGAQEKVKALEYELFTEVRETVAKALHRIQKTATAIAKLDFIYSLAYTAAKYNYHKPEISLDGRIEIIDGRHPVVEAIGDISFVPNDTVLDEKDNRCAIITGPNMAGKSTYMRQTALITLMAQIGSFVPAKSAHIGIVDAIYTRVGASDDLSAGQSTFMVEMSEVATIMKNATAKSLLILDEIGRGTSTFDGMSIARAVLEYATDKKKLGAKTMFATHYHELTELEELLPGVKNYNIAVKKRGDDITFLRRIVRGGADDSYGIEVAKLAGVPEEIVHRAKQILKVLESNEITTQRAAKIIADEEDELEITLMSGSALDFIDKLKIMDVNTLTPIEAMTILHDLIKQARNI